MLKIIFNTIIPHACVSLAEQIYESSDISLCTLYGTLNGKHTESYVAEMQTLITMLLFVINDPDCEQFPLRLHVWMKCKPQLPF